MKNHLLLVKPIFLVVYEFKLDRVGAFVGVGWSDDSEKVLGFGNGLMQFLEFVSPVKKTVFRRDVALLVDDLRVAAPMPVSVEAVGRVLWLFVVQAFKDFETS